jgi:hypothetical protein
MPNATQPLIADYTNWKGSRRPRRITPLEIFFGSTQWHPDAQWLIHARDEDTGEERDFAFSGFLQPAGNDAAVAAIEYAMHDDDPKAFLNAWMHGDFDVIRREWDDVPDEVFIGAELGFKPGDQSRACCVKGA